MLSLFSTLKWVCDTNGVHEGATLWLSKFFMKHPSAVAHNAGIRMKCKLDRLQKEGKVMSYCEADNFTFLRRTYRRHIC